MKDYAKAIIFDYGGTLDTNGRHWAEVIWEQYKKHEVDVSYEDYRAAYIHVEKFFGRERIIQPYFNFLDTMYHKIKHQFTELGYTDRTALNSIAEECYKIAALNVAISKILLTALKEKYPISLVSNFYGNLNSVLEDFGMTHFFDHIIESETVRLRKPDPAIFKLALEKTKYKSEETVIIADSYKNDIAPAKQLGCPSIWLRVQSFHTADDQIFHPCIIRDITAVKDILLP